MNLNNEQIGIVNQVLSTLRVICGALISGLVIFALITFVITNWNNVSTQPELLPLIGIGLGVLGIAQAFVLPGLFTAGAAKAANENSERNSNELVRKLAGLFQTKTIVGYAFLEGAAFLNLILFMVCRNLLQLTVAAFAIAIMIVLIPRNESAISWIEERMQS